MRNPKPKPRRIDLEDQGDVAGRSVSPITHAVTPGIPIINPLAEFP